jgi:hypothetical protein
LRDGEKVFFRPLNLMMPGCIDYPADVIPEDLRLRFFAPMREVRPG